MLGVEHTFLSCITDWVGVGVISGSSDVEPGVTAGMQHTQDALRCPSGGIRRHFAIWLGCSSFEMFGGDQEEASGGTLTFRWESRGGE